MKVHPTTNRVLVKMNKNEEIKSKGGILLEVEGGYRDQVAKETGTVVAVGPNVFEDYEGQEPVKPGDEVYITRYSGMVLEAMSVDKGDTFRIVNDEDIYGIVERN